MKKTLLNLLLACTLLIALTSCGSLKSYNFKTSGMPDNDSSYLVTASGKHVDAASIDVKPGKVTVDGKPYPLDDIAYIRSKKMYFGVSDGKIYLGEVYGKINLLYQLIEVPTYSPNYHTPGSGYGNSSMFTGTTTQKKYYIQKRGSTDIDRMTVGTVLDYVADNDEALEIAKGARNWKRGYLASWGVLGAATVYSFAKLFGSAGLDANGNAKDFSLVGPGIALGGSLILMTTTNVTYNRRMFKAIEAYNK